MPSLLSVILLRFVRIHHHLTLNEYFTFHALILSFPLLSSPFIIYSSRSEQVRITIVSERRNVRKKEYGYSAPWSSQ